MMCAIDMPFDRDAGRSSRGRLAALPLPCFAALSLPRLPMIRSGVDD